MEGLANSRGLGYQIDLKDDLFWKNTVRLYGKRLEVVASNIANADTPNYKARDIDFKAALAETLSASTEVKSSGLLKTKSPELNFSALLYRASPKQGVDGNTVDLDIERTAFADASIRYEFAMQQAVGEYREISELFKTLT